MKIVTLEQETDSEGYLHLNIPSELKSTKTEVFVIINPIVEKRKGYDFSEFAGKLEWKGDALELQKKIRSEWP